MTLVIDCIQYVVYIIYGLEVPCHAMFVTKLSVWLAVAPPIHLSLIKLAVARPQTPALIGRWAVHAYIDIRISDLKKG